MPELPARPSAEHLRKAAKRLARERTVRLSEAQRMLANEHGFRTWAALVRHVANVPRDAEPRLFAAVRSLDVEAVRAALAGGENPRRYFEGETALHAAARAGSLAIVETLIAGGALEWQVDDAGRTPLAVARRGRKAERAGIVAILDRNAIADPSFRAAVAAIHSGDVQQLVRLLDAEPRLLRDRNVGPDVFRQRKRADYFRDPKLFWYVANNPIVVDRMPANIVDVTLAMIERGVEAADLDYTLGLVMTSSVAREQGHQLPLMSALLAAGAVPTRETIASTAAHCELEPLRALIAAGRPPDVLLAATLGDAAALGSLLPSATRDDVATAFGLAVINRQVVAARLALAAGADVNAFLPVHSHGTALHHAAGNDDVPMIELLLAAGARVDIRDTLWDGTPLGWAEHGAKTAAAEVLANASPP